jgi:hypothetical protein
MIFLNFFLYVAAAAPLSIRDEAERIVHVSRQALELGRELGFERTCIKEMAEHIIDLDTRHPATNPTPQGVYSQALQTRYINLISILRTTHPDALPLVWAALMKCFRGDRKEKQATKRFAKLSQEGLYDGDFSIAWAHRIEAHICNPPHITFQRFKEVIAVTDVIDPADHTMRLLTIFGKWKKLNKNLKEETNRLTVETQQCLEDIDLMLRSRDLILPQEVQFVYTCLLSIAFKDVDAPSSNMDLSKIRASSNMDIQTTCLLYTANILPDIQIYQQLTTRRQRLETARSLSQLLQEKITDFRASVYHPDLQSWERMSCLYQEEAARQEICRETEKYQEESKATFTLLQGQTKQDPFQKSALCQLLRSGNAVLIEDLHNFGFVYCITDLSLSWNFFGPKGEWDNVFKQPLQLEEIKKALKDAGFKDTCLD